MTSKRDTASISEVDMAARDHARSTCAATPKSAAPEMVQRIALRLWEQEMQGFAKDFGAQSTETQTYWRDAARIAIEAMREPTSYMLAQAVLSAVVGEPSAEDFAATGAVLERLPPTGHPDSRVVIAEIRRDYRAAIHAALHGPEGGPTRIASPVPRPALSETQIMLERIGEALVPGTKVVFRRRILAEAAAFILQHHAVLAVASREAESSPPSSERSSPGRPKDKADQ